ncbi:ACP S-malonyltransferase [Allostreptomyces psammosilenae]|uniref:Malonyl CoA-acyl carrier protein transacylase n=1 Tax=Allostreptomyces psammosilenae TaxID=1892865 RepID=A0A852ZTJ3_9ACTN|nr:ACP S-malonyltransferase [Allostreptomyces psammosilenae]NYI04600.1 malonyl CoA-acyl carrier protein transacylase [Allostreptomyces psammosilenae]
MHCLVFPGQGVQRKGMGEELFDRYPEETAAASELLGYPVARLCRDDPDGRLADTRYAQPAVFLVNALSWMDLERAGRRYDYFAGHSLGEFNALVAAGVIDLMDGLALVRRRAELMAGITRGAMAAVVGMSSARVEATLHGAGLNLVHVANRNSDRQVTVAGDRPQLALAVKALRGPGVRVLPVSVSGPFHTPLMAPAGRAFAAVLREYEFRAGHTPVMSSVTAAEFTPDQAAQLLSRQIHRPVEWVRTVRALRAAGVDHFDEVNGTTLTALIAQISAQPTEEHA